MDIQKIITNLDYDSAYTITFGSIDNQKCYDLWLDKEDTSYCLQEIYMLDGIPDEVGDTITYSRSEIARKLTEFSSQEQFHIREVD
ncbi:hypothetical protein [Paenibacillus vini]|uniref:Uncharacterized protein n=1 Tax=Paenibacillus vini TaxID=1476024 RepID=A0ABQ4MBB5_9BACL|nr:hypothetical protein [Paenibacillus vini]GIP52947.1 hypothetical protein J42TS3_19820 [Paenibacillus vini]